jgi:hypothetical protein
MYSMRAGPKGQVVVPPLGLTAGRGCVPVGCRVSSASSADDDSVGRGRHCLDTDGHRMWAHRPPWPSCGCERQRLCRIVNRPNSMVPEIRILGPLELARGEGS